MSNYIHFVVFDRNSGKIVQNGICLPEFLALQTSDPELMALEAAAGMTGETHRVDLSSRGVVPIDS